MTKTCGECKHLNRELAFCRACGAKWIKETDGASCKYFEKKTPPTNREVFFSKRSNEELAGDYTRFCDENGRWLADLCGTWHDAKHEALQANLNWLNAPAESEVESEP